MDWKHLYLSTEGRISRKTFWTGSIVLWLVGLPVMLLPMIALISFGLMNDFQVAGRVIMGLNLAVAAIYAYPAYCLAVKRRHDRGSAGWDVLGYLVASGAFLVSMVIVTADGRVGRFGFSPVASWLGYGMQAYGIYMFVVLACLKGTSGKNKYGADPTIVVAPATA